MTRACDAEFSQMLAEARQARDQWLDELYLAQRCKDEARQLACRHHLTGSRA